MSNMEHKFDPAHRPETGRVILPELERSTISPIRAQGWGMVMLGAMLFATGAWAILLFVMTDWAWLPEFAWNLAVGALAFGALLLSLGLRSVARSRMDVA